MLKKTTKIFSKTRKRKKIKIYVYKMTYKCSVHVGGTPWTGFNIAECIGGGGVEGRGVQIVKLTILGVRDDKEYKKGGFCN